MKKFFFIYTAIVLFSFDNKTSAQTNHTKETVFITSVSNTQKTVNIDADFVQILTGKAAIKAAKKTGEAEYEVNKKGDTTWYVPNDYFVLNENTKIRQLTLSSSVQIYLVKAGTSSVAKSNVTKLKKSFEGKLFRLTILNNTVTDIKEIYTP